MALRRSLRQSEIEPSTMLVTILCYTLILLAPKSSAYDPAAASPEEIARREPDGDYILQEESHVPQAIMLQDPYAEGAAIRKAEKKRYWNRKPDKFSELMEESELEEIMRAIVPHINSNRVDFREQEDQFNSLGEDGVTRSVMPVVEPTAANEKEIRISAEDIKTGINQRELSVRVLQKDEKKELEQKMKPFVNDGQKVLVQNQRLPQDTHIESTLKSNNNNKEINMKDSNTNHETRGAPQGSNLGPIIESKTNKKKNEETDGQGSTSSKVKALPSEVITSTPGDHVKVEGNNSRHPKLIPSSGPNINSPSEEEISQKIIHQIAKGVVMQPLPEYEGASYEYTDTKNAYEESASYEPMNEENVKSQVEIIHPVIQNGQQHPVQKVIDYEVKNIKGTVSNLSVQKVKPQQTEDGKLNDQNPVKTKNEQDSTTIKSIVTINQDKTAIKATEKPKVSQTDKTSTEEIQVQTTKATEEISNQDIKSETSKPSSDLEPPKLVQTIVSEDFDDKTTEHKEAKIELNKVNTLLIEPSAELEAPKLQNMILAEVSDIKNNVDKSEQTKISDGSERILVEPPSQELEIPLEEPIDSEVNSAKGLIVDTSEPKITVLLPNEIKTISLETTIRTPGGSRRPEADKLTETIESNSPKDAVPISKTDKLEIRPVQFVSDQKSSEMNDEKYDQEQISIIDVTTQRPKHIIKTMLSHDEHIPIRLEQLNQSPVLRYVCATSGYRDVPESRESENSQKPLSTEETIGLRCKFVQVNMPPLNQEPIAEKIHVGIENKDDSVDISAKKISDEEIRPYEDSGTAEQNESESTDPMEMVEAASHKTISKVKMTQDPWNKRNNYKKLTEYGIIPYAYKVSQNYERAPIWETLFPYQILSTKHQTVEQKYQDFESNGRTHYLEYAQEEEKENQNEYQRPKFHEVISTHYPNTLANNEVKYYPQFRYAPIQDLLRQSSSNIQQFAASNVPIYRIGGQRRKLIPVYVINNSISKITRVEGGRRSEESGTAEGLNSGEINVSEGHGEKNRNIRVEGLQRADVFEEDTPVASRPASILRVIPLAETTNNRRNLLKSVENRDASWTKENREQRHRDGTKTSEITSPEVETIRKQEQNIKTEPQHKINKRAIYNNPLLPKYREDRFNEDKEEQRRPNNNQQPMRWLRYYSHPIEAHRFEYQPIVRQTRDYEPIAFNPAYFRANHGYGFNEWGGLGVGQ